MGTLGSVSKNWLDKGLTTSSHEKLIVRKTATPTLSFVESYGPILLGGVYYPIVLSGVHRILKSYTSSLQHLHEHWPTRYLRLTYE